MYYITSVPFSFRTDFSESGSHISRSFGGTKGGINYNYSYFFNDIITSGGPPPPHYYSILF